MKVDSEEPVISGHITKGKEPKLGEVRASVFYLSSTSYKVWARFYKVLNPCAGPEDSSCVGARTLGAGCLGQRQDAITPSPRLHMLA